MKKRLAYRGALVTTILIVLFWTTGYAQHSGRQFRRSAIHNANLVKTVFGNWGVIGQPGEAGPRGAWIHDNNGYIGDVSPMVGAEVALDSVVFHSVVVTPVSRPTQNQEESSSGQFWGFEPDGRYFNNNQGRVALSTNKNSWPPFWPDKLDDPEDPGWRGAWNGLFGKDVFNADQESFFVIDDDNDEEFNSALNNSLGVAFKPDANDASRNGLGLEVKARGLQWAQFLAQDTIFWLYEILNRGTTDYTRAAFGMLVGTYIGVTGNTQSGNEFDDDYSFFDVELDMTFTADFDDNVRRNPLWVGSAVGVVAYAFLESPGNPFDGIDNDGDAEGALIPTGPFFTEQNFEPRIFNSGDQVVIVGQNFERTLVTVPAGDTVFVTRSSGVGENTIAVTAGVTELSEGNLLIVNGQEQVNPNAFDGIDNDLDGLIDENVQLHFRQIRRDQDGNVLIDIRSPKKYVDYVNSDGINNSLIDERRDDGIDNDNDWDSDFDDVGADGQPDTGDAGENDGVPTAGEPNIDQTDVDESDQIGLTSFDYFVPANIIDLADDEELWGRMAPGFFTVPASIQNNKPTNGEDGDFVYGSGFFPLLAKRIERFSLALVYGDGGGRNVIIDDLLKNRVTVQKIFDADYRFPQPPKKPILTAVPGDGKVTLYWDREAEDSVDPVLRIKDFEGYKIFKATDAGFLDAFQVTDALGVVTTFKPLKQFDLANNISGFFRPSDDLLQDARGLSFFLGENSGLQHTFVDDDVDNGRTYFYAVVAYDRGDAEADIFPSENTKFVTRLSSGAFLTDINTAVIVPNAPAAGFVAPENSEELETIAAVGTGRTFFEVVDNMVQTGHRYRLEFDDTSTDGIDNNDNWRLATDDVGNDGLPGTNDADGSEGNGKADPGEPNVDLNDNEERLVKVTYSYSVRDLTGVSHWDAASSDIGSDGVPALIAGSRDEDGTEGNGEPNNGEPGFFAARDTLFANLFNTNIVEGTVEIRSLSGELVPNGNYVLDAENGKIKAAATGLLNDEAYTISYQYYPVFQSRNIQRSPFAAETGDTDVFDGIQLVFDNTPDRPSIALDEGRSGFSVATPLKFTFKSNFTVITDPIAGTTATLLPYPSDYEIRFFDAIVDTSLPPPAPIFIPGVPLKFQVWNLTENEQIEILFTDRDRNNTISANDQIRFFEKGVGGELVRTWDMFFFVTGNDTAEVFGEDVVLALNTVKPYRNGDLLEFSTQPAVVTEQRAQQTAALEQIRVVPNPYIVATAFEQSAPPGIRGRGERKIDFTRLPSDARVHIFTSRGERIVTLEHSGNIHDGTISWNLKTRENLDVAYGIYFYVIESSVGVKRGKLGIIK